ncbi:restriction endonuclease subunit S [Zobellia galactanivorans]|uniref:restriction endonuclease subunit S n=1 Tax=Zobellia galactanivorans (strain DSM 12802 / CCUG 47099 / CIP 106680 / NCIMB 13871 / Dsij) TaxID=63186 RepID=UPI001C07AC0B|nr:restriction endonuclease subunit S [Zobellia galactanivorans]MBU3025905.1 restriction endonuclease subunit S [Zobellia galactanivorans]
METLLCETLSIDKTTWTPVKFGEVVFEPKESTKDPITDGIEHVVGLEHIESEDIHLRNSATIEEATTFTKSFSKGDVLFGRRRAYLKKAAQAFFSGICSGDITVFRAKENLLPELLPFVVQNEKFFDYAIKHSAGGLSPRVKFKDLANYEFLLPPKDQQAKLAELLWAMDEVVERENVILDKNINLRKSQLKETYFTIPIKHRSEKVILEKLIKLSSGKTRPKDLRDKPIDNYVYPVYGGNGIIGYSKDYLIEYDTIVLGRVGEYCGVVHDTSGKIWVSDNALYVKEYLGSFDKYYLSRFLEYIDLNKQQNKSSHPLITQSKVCSNSIPMLSKELMRKQNLKLKGIEELILNLKSKISSSKALQKSLINQVF